MTLLERIFGRPETSKSVAKNRLQFILQHDRAAISPEVMNQLKAELLAVIAKYVEIDEHELQIDLERADTAVSLVANIPIRRVRT
jgi:cell division topological specificity factor